MCKSKERGSALITVILVVLVLTMVGLASLFFMTTEERISSVARLEKASFYAAEVGLRRAERSIVTQYNANPNFINSALSYIPPLPQTNWNVLQVPNGGSVHPSAVVLTDPLDTELIGGQDPALQIIDPANDQIPPAEMRGILVDNSQGYITTYNIYIRNDDEETTATDTNNKVSIISVGLLVTPSGQIVKKVLEEGIAPIGAMQGGRSLQDNADTGGTGSN